MATRMKSVQKLDYPVIVPPRLCVICREQEHAIRKLWSQVQDRAHPTNFTWHCHVCGKDIRIAVD